MIQNETGLHCDNVDDVHEVNFNPQLVEPQNVDPQDSISNVQSHVSYKTLGRTSSSSQGRRSSSSGLPAEAENAALQQKDDLEEKGQRDNDSILKLKNTSGVVFGNLFKFCFWPSLCVTLSFCSRYLHQGGYAFVGIGPSVRLSVLQNN